MRIAVPLVAALGLVGCAHSGGGYGVTASANYADLSAVRGRYALDGARVAVVESRRCSLGRNDRTAVLAALAHVEPEYDHDEVGGSDGPQAGSGLVIVFRQGQAVATTVMLQAAPLRRGQARVYVRVNGRFGSIAPGDLQAIQAAVIRSGCRMSLHGRGVA